ncbi:MAG TPA: phosphoglycerate kinase [Thermohalobaculum sp.]|nr:phosphoglycerate kinase [Thermohalobaculum sp.]
MRTLDDVDLDGLRALVRVDLNVPLKDGRVTDDTRLRAVRPTIDDIVARGGRTVLLSHLGRPKGQPRPELSLEQVVPALSAALGREVRFGGEGTGEAAVEASRALAPGEVLLVENTRFHAGEEANDGGLARAFARLGDVFVMDAFAAAHRAHATTEGLAHLMPACAGRLMQAEIEALTRALETPERPLVAVVGGAKVSTKIDLLSNLIARTDVLVIGGAMANTFLAAEGMGVGRSLHEPDLLETARGIMAKAEASDCRIVLPNDVVVAETLEEGAESETVPTGDVRDDMMILDLGPDTAEAIKAAFDAAKTLVWNGPLGAFETPPFDAATNACAEEAARLTDAGALVSVAGGGDTVAALNRAGVTERFTYVSTAGGAFLEWLEGKTLPGVAALG